MSLLVAVALTAAVLAARGPGGRPVSRVVRRRGDRAGPVEPGGAAVRPLRGGGPAGSGGGPPWRGLGPFGRGRPPQPGREPDLAVVVTEVAARLRAGADPGRAWREALGRAVEPGGPTVADLCRASSGRQAAATVVAATRLATELGAPLAPMLDEVAAGLAADAEAEGERRAALAGPRATARVLTGLPLLGVLLGVAVGADPLAVLLDGSTGSAALGAGVALVLTGRLWTTRLARGAAAAGRSP